MSKKECLFAQNAPKALGPYNVATRFGELVFASGQLGLDPATGELVPGGIEAEARQALLNMQNVLEASGSSLEAVLKTTVFLRDMSEFAKMNAIYAEFFRDDFPARSTIQVAALPRGGAVEIEAIACLVS
jgi:2-iminobutanoate/2-iminopropanoate deaminase